MSDHQADDNDHGPFAIDLSVAHVARFENVVAGGSAHFAVDRAAVESVCEVAAGGLQGLRAQIEALNDFVARAVAVLSADLGIRQYLDIGMMTPESRMVHEVASAAGRTSGIRVVYASYDTTTLAHVHALGHGPAAARVAHIHHPYDDPEGTLRQAAATLDFDRPVAVILPATLSLVPDDGVARHVVTTLRSAMAPGSYLVMAHVSFDDAPAGSDKVLARFNQVIEQPYVVRTKPQILDLLTGFEVLEPGVVRLDCWRPDDLTDQDEVVGDPPRSPAPPLVLLYGGVGRKQP
jgi:hypothetical protein